MAARLLFGTVGAVLKLTISNPEARNAMHPDIYRGGIEAMARASTDPTVRAVVITGEGEHFCAGGNLNRLLANRNQPPEIQAESIDAMHGWIMAIRDCPKPVIAAVEGAAAGAGFSVALACDLLVAADNARFVMSYIRVGLTPDGGASHWLASRLPYPLAFEMLALGQPVTAKRLQALGLVNELSEPGGALAAAMARASELADGPSFALGRIKSLLGAATRDALAHQLVRERENFLASLFHDDAGEGIAAFLAKRAPAYHGNKDGK